MVAAVDDMNNTAADKLLQILLAFENEPEWQLKELAKSLELAKSTLHRHLGKLKEYGLVEQDKTTNTYRLGFGAWRLALRARPYERLRRTARPHLEGLTAILRETTFLTVAEGINSFCIDRSEGSQRLRFSMEVGSQAPLHLGASNLVLLANLPPEDREQAVRHWVPTVSERAKLLADLEAIRQQGFVYTVAQLTPGVAALAVPILRDNRTPLMGLSVGGYSQRFTRHVAMKALPLLQKTGEKLTRQLQSALAPQEKVYL